MSTLSEPDRAISPATMRDVAALADVSVKTVSRVVNAENGVSPALTLRVQQAVRLLGYRHNLNASSLRRADRKTATIGLLLEDVGNPFSSALHRAIEDIAHNRRTMVFAGSSDEDPRRQREVLQALVSRQVDGLIAVPAGIDPSGFLAERDRSGIPIVFVDRQTPLPGFDTVTVDNRGGAAQAVSHLYAAGHRRVAFLGDVPTIWTAAERHAGYAAALNRAGLPVAERLVRLGLRGVEAAEAATLALLDEPDPPTAFFTAQNLLTIGAVRALRRLGRQHDVALVGFDDFPLADLLDPGVTVVVQDPAAIGRTAAELLFARLDGDSGPPRAEVLPTWLVARGSGELPGPAAAVATVVPQT